MTLVPSPLECPKRIGLQASHRPEAVPISSPVNGAQTQGLILEPRKFGPQPSRRPSAKVMKPHPSRWSGPSSLLFSLVAILVLGQLLVQLTEASPIDINVANRDDLTSEEVSEMLRGDPSYVLGMLSQLRSNILKPLEKSSRHYYRRPMPSHLEGSMEDPDSNKRAIDFGLGRGYSGNQAAKHFMGLVASQYAGGPGKKRKRVDPGLLMNPKYSRPEGRSGR